MKCAFLIIISAFVYFSSELIAVNHQYNSSSSRLVQRQLLEKATQFHCMPQMIVDVSSISLCQIYH